ncbi:hypothetical protein BU23DRAFT_651529 [Bimuria novae-zelandiae CBS 107.79]|uniref:Uncharacterized protein n=1 Tax=Bimuria novae-zelandiae CBS 107.79 TaxID=1447943 RepID=A0A6A5VLQ4_9PLEO|nr:hypothetical protein BU23DRAFT_651529 [Bimuria novae-zelandiae CBS 107.79]
MNAERDKVGLAVAILRSLTTDDDIISAVLENPAAILECLETILPHVHAPGQHLSPGPAPLVGSTSEFATSGNARASGMGTTTHTAEDSDATDRKKKAHAAHMKEYRNRKKEKVRKFLEHHARMQQELYGTQEAPTISAASLADYCPADIRPQLSLPDAHGSKPGSEQILDAAPDPELPSGILASSKKPIMKVYQGTHQKQDGPSNQVVKKEVDRIVTKRKRTSEVSVPTLVLHDNHGKGNQAPRPEIDAPRKKLSLADAESAAGPPQSSKSSLKKPRAASKLPASDKENMPPANGFGPYAPARPWHLDAVGYFTALPLLDPPLPVTPATILPSRKSQTQQHAEGEK